MIRGILLPYFVHFVGDSVTLQRVEIASSVQFPKVKENSLGGLDTNFASHVPVGAYPTSTIHRVTQLFWQNLPCCVLLVEPVQIVLNRSPAFYKVYRCRIGAVLLLQIGQIAWRCVKYLTGALLIEPLQIELNRRRIGAVLHLAIGKLHRWCARNLTGADLKLTQALCHVFGW